MLEVHGLYAGYGGAAVIRDVSVTAHPGEIVAVLGPNGAGKTTLLSTVFGRLAPMAGSVQVCGTSTVGKKPHQVSNLGVGYVPENRALAPSLTVRENLLLVRRWVSDPFELFPELKPIANRKAGLLSGGEQQMLTVARALVSDPKVVLMDELSFGLAPILVARLFERLRELTDAHGRTVLLVEQQVKAALRIADRVYVLSHGDLVLESPAAALRDDPSILAASYFGADSD